MCTVSTARLTVGRSAIRTGARTRVMEASIDMPPLSAQAAGASSSAGPNRTSSAVRRRTRISSLRTRTRGAPLATVALVRVPVIAAALLTIAGAVEVLLASDGRLASALALPAVTLPVARSRGAPLPALWIVTVALAAQAAAGGLPVGAAGTPIVVLAPAPHCAARYAEDGWAFAGAAAAGVGVALTRIAFDPAAQGLREAAMTFVAVATALMVGRWASGQRLLQRELADRAARRARDRARDAEHAAEEERARIAADLQSAVAGGLHAIATEAAALRDDLRAGETPDARDRLARIAATARAALADVRRVLGVLRHPDEPRRLTPPTGVTTADEPRHVAPAAGGEQQIVPHRNGLSRTPHPAARLVDRALVVGVVPVVAAE